jgi:uncharacterized protein (PEP-CTERM system associated)
VRTTLLVTLAWAGTGVASAQTTPAPEPVPPAAPPAAAPTLTPRAALPPAPPTTPAPPAPATAQSASPFALWLRTDLVATDNGAMAPRGLERRDLIATLGPRITYHRKGAGLSIDVDAAATARYYANDSQDNRVVPQVRASAAAEIVERWLYLDAAARVHEVEPDSFAAPVNSAAGTRGRTARELTVAPALRRDLSSTTSLLASHTTSIAEGATGTDARRTEQASVARLALEPQPLGGALEWSRRDTRASVVAAGLSDRTTLEQLRASGTLRVAHEFDLSVHVGSERSRLEDGSDERDGVAGVGLRWHPGPRTDARLTVERRFFGTGGSLAFTHRMPFLATSVDLARGPQGAALAPTTAGFGANLAGLLDAMLTTRHPDEGERRALVDAEVQRLGADNSRLAEPRRIESGALQLVTSGRVSFALLGLRNVIALSAYAQDARALERDTAAATGTPPGVGLDQRQYGARLDASHRLSPLLSLQAGVQWTRVEGLGNRSDEQSRATLWHASLSRRLGPRTVAAGGLQHQRFDSTAAGQQSFRATALLVGMTHRF